MLYRIVGAITWVLAGICLVALLLFIVTRDQTVAPFFWLSIAVYWGWILGFVVMEVINKVRGGKERQ